MDYKKGKDIKCPFDCLFHYFTRRIEPVCSNKSEVGYPRNVAYYYVKGYEIQSGVSYTGSKDEGFETW